MRGVKIHDIETFSNLFVYCDIDRDTKEERVFVLWRHINQIPELIEYLREGHKLVGYNSTVFDGQVLTHIMNNGVSDVREIYRFAQNVIRDTSRGGYPPIPEWKLKNKQLDLLKMWHYDNPARFTRLKDLQIAMDWETVVDTPLDHTEDIEYWSDVQLVIDYCLNDIRSTFEFYQRSRELIDMRVNLSEIFGLNLVNANDPKMGSEVFAKLLSEKMGITMKELKQMRTFRSSIDFNEIILDYIKFDNPLLVGLLDLFKRTTVRETKGSFKQSVKLKGFKFDLGLGGIHGCVKSGVYEAGHKKILDIDVVSFYPNLAIENGFYPEHLGVYFCEIFKRIFMDRKNTLKTDPRNYAYKIMLNGVYGKSNDPDSYLYDPKFTMQITINGQLLILMLAEKLLDLGVDILQANTDGLTIMYDTDKETDIYDICDKWQKLTKLELEYAEYSKMVIKDVNNYIGIYTNGKVKYKGSFESLDSSDKKFINWHKDPSFRIVAKAVNEYFINGAAVSSTIMTERNIYQFIGRAKFKSDSYGETRTVKNGSIVKEKQQKTTRYLVTNNGCQFMKVYEKGSEQVINSGYQISIANNLRKGDFNKYDINYKFYIQEANKIIEVIEGNKNQLMLF